jgi:hypothetical protein
MAQQRSIEDSADANMHPCAVGRMTTSFTSTSAGCSMANAIVRAIVAGGIAIFSIRSPIWALTPGSVMEFARFVWTNPGEMLVTRNLGFRQFSPPGEVDFLGTGPVTTLHSAGSGEGGNHQTNRLAYLSTFLFNLAEGKRSRHKGHAGTASACVHTRDTRNVHSSCYAREASGSDRGRHAILSGREDLTAAEARDVNCTETCAFLCLRLFERMAGSCWF